MSDRITAFTVILKEPVHEEWGKQIQAAISLLSGVEAVVPIIQDLFSDAIAVDRYKYQALQEVSKVLLQPWVRPKE